MDITLCKNASIMVIALCKEKWFCKYVDMFRTEELKIPDNNSLNGSAGVCTFPEHRLSTAKKLSSKNCIKQI